KSAGMLGDEHDVLRAKVYRSRGPLIGIQRLWIDLRQRSRQIILLDALPCIGREMDEHTHFEVLPFQLVCRRKRQLRFDAGAFAVELGLNHCCAGDGRGKRSARGGSSKRADKSTPVHSLSSPGTTIRCGFKDFKTRPIAASVDARRVDAKRSRRGCNNQKLLILFKKTVYTCIHDLYDHRDELINHILSSLLMLIPCTNPLAGGCTSMKAIRFIQFIALLLTLMFVSAAVAQTVTGTVTGEVTDPSGAVVSGAQVIAHNVSTGVDSPTTTNKDGFYRIQSLPIGRYEVTVQATGFDRVTIPAFSLEVLQTANFNVKLKVGTASTTMKVSAAAPILNTTSATLGSTITANTIRNFPLNGLDFSALTLYVPGSIDTNGTSGTTSFERSTFNSDTPNMNGNRAQANNYTLDGIDMNETFNNLISYSPAPESLQEVHVMTANAPADYGNVNGGDVISVLKSGTNQFHGVAYGYVQDYRVNANTWTNNQQVPAIPINPYSQAQFGGALGGPIKKNRLFFFVDYLGSRYHKGGTGSESVFSQDMRNGNFSTLLAQSNPIQLYDPENGFAPFVGDAGVPIVNPVAKYLFANPDLYPLPNATPSDGIVANNYQGPQRSYKANNQGDAKIEFDPRSSDKITGFYSMSTAYDGSTPVLAISFPGVNLYPTKLGGATWVHIF